MWAMVAKEFRELRRDRRTAAMMIVLPVLLLVVFGYAANFKVHDIPAVVTGPDAGHRRRGGPAARRRCGRRGGDRRQPPACAA
jgi:ABC-2 type transport system permease protein